MHKGPVEGLGYIRIHLLEINYPMIENKIQIRFTQCAETRVSLPLEIRQQHISHACQEYQDIAQTKQIKTVYVFPVPIIEVKIDPAMITCFPVNQDMIPP